MVEPLARFLAGLFDIGVPGHEIGAGPMAMRAVLVYVALIALVRLGNKRSMGKATAFDVVLFIMIGAVAARGLTGGARLESALAAVVVLVGMHWLFGAMAARWEKFGRLIKGHSTVIIVDGIVRRRALKARHLTEEDLAEMLRLEGVASPGEVAEARLERSGRLSVIRLSAAD